MRLRHARQGGLVEPLGAGKRAAGGNRAGLRPQRATQPVGDGRHEALFGATPIKLTKSFPANASAKENVPTPIINL